MNTPAHPPVRRQVPVFRLVYHGNPWQFLALQYTNLFLTVITLGGYLPWARAGLQQYVYQELELLGSRFRFTGRGSELMRGILMVLGLVVLYRGVQYLQEYLIFTSPDAVDDFSYRYIGIFASIAVLVIIPLALHGMARYRLSRISWRGIGFRYMGSMKEMYWVCLKGAFYTIITFGIYFNLIRNDIRRYVINHTRAGNLRFEFTGGNGELLGITIGGVFLTIISFGLAFPLLLRNIWRYYYGNIIIWQGKRKITLRLDLTTRELYLFCLTNGLLILFTAGLAFPVVMIHYRRMICQNLVIRGWLLPDVLHQNEEDLPEAAGDQLGSFIGLDIGI